MQDALLPKTFDGTTHVVLEQVSARLLAIAISVEAGHFAPPEAIADDYRHPPQAFADASAMPGAPIVADPARYADWIGTSAAWRDLAPVAAIIRILLYTVLASQKSGRWQGDQAFRLAAAESLSWAEAVLSLADLAGPGIRARHCLPSLPSANDDFRGLVDVAMGHCGLLLAGRVQTLQLLSGSEADPALKTSLAHFAGSFNRGTAHFDAHPGALLTMVGSWT